MDIEMHAPGETSSPLDSAGAEQGIRLCALISRRGIVKDSHHLGFEASDPGTLDCRFRSSMTLLAA